MTLRHVRIVGIHAIRQALSIAAIGRCLHFSWSKFWAKLIERYISRCRGGKWWTLVESQYCCSVYFKIWTTFRATTTRFQGRITTIGGPAQGTKHFTGPLWGALHRCRILFNCYLAMSRLQQNMLLFASAADASESFTIEVRRRSAFSPDSVRKISYLLNTIFRVQQVSWQQ